MHREEARSLEPTLLIDQAARRLGMSRRTVYYKIQSGELRTIRTRGGSQRVLACSIDELAQRRAKTKAKAVGVVGRLDAEALALQIQALA